MYVFMSSERLSDRPGRSARKSQYSTTTLVTLTVTMPGLDDGSRYNPIDSYLPPPLPPFPIPAIDAATYDACRVWTRIARKFLM